LHELCREISKDKKFHVTILCPSAKGTQKKEPFKTLRAWTLIKDRKKIENFGILEYFQNYSFVIPAIFKGKEFIKKEKIDLIHAHFGLSFGLVGAILKKATGSPLVITLHGSGFNFKGWRKIFRPLTRYVLKNADSILAVSSSLKKMAEKETPKKIKVIPNSVSPEEFRNKKSDFVLSVGRLAKLKGFDFLIRAAADPRLKKVKFKIIGDGPEKENLGQLISSLGIKNFELVGALSHEKTKEFMSRCSIFCLPSLSEGLPLVILEAMACGKPVVSTGVGGVTEAVENKKNGFVVKTKNSKEISNNIYKLIKNKNLREKMGKISQKKILSNFNWKKNSLKIKKIYSEILN
jgi:glycosyltransferase involved in cell wall biosynthesis